ncbi:SirB1 family protein [soil metagenome]
MDPTWQFTELVNRPDVDLERAALAVAAHARADLDADEALQVLDRLAAGCRVPTLDGLRAHLFGEAGFRGNHEAYYEPENSFLDRVLQRRTGIPLTLAVVTVGVGRRLGLHLAPVGMPGHVLVRDLDAPDTFVDAFNGGMVLDGAACARLFRALHGDDAPFDPVLLAPTPACELLVRLLANLKQIYHATGDRRALAWVLRLRTAIPGTAPEERAELATVLAADGRFDTAAAELGDLAAAAHAPERAEEYRATATRLRARLN